jgi:cobalt-zinc-cadmium efflux system outer membrane protein
MNPRTTNYRFQHLRLIVGVVFSCYLAQIHADSNPVNEPTEPLVLSQALALALTNNPLLSAFSKETRAREAATLQAGLLPNPVFDVEGSNFGNNKFKGADGDAITLQLSQLIELGGKRAARIETATLTQELANWDYETQRVNVLTQVTQTFVEVLTAQQRLELLQQMLDLADQVVETASARVRAGSVAPLEATRAKVTRASSKIEWIRAQRTLETARKRLAATWGSTMPHFKSVQGNLNKISQPPSLDDLTLRLEQNPDLARWATEISQRQAIIDMEKSKVIPDITLSLGTNQYLDGDDYNLNAGISIPIPLFNRNQGGILAAVRRLGKTEDERRNAEVSITTELNSVYLQLDAAYAELTALDEDVIPGAESAFNVASRGYRLGEFSFLDVLDAQRTLFDVKAQYLQAQADYHLNVARIERLIGGPLNPLSESVREINQ